LDLAGVEEGTNRGVQVTPSRRRRDKDIIFFFKKPLLLAI